MKNTLKVFLLLGMAQSAFAGTELHLNSGKISTLQVARTTLTRTLENQKQSFIVQFKNKIMPQDQAWLKSQQVEVFSYIPDDALLVRAKGSVVDTILQNDKVQAVVDYQSAMKLSSELGRSSIFNQNELQQVLVKTFTVSDAQNLVSLLDERAPQVEVLHQEGRFLVLKANRFDVFKMAELSLVESVQAQPDLVPMHMKLEPIDGSFRTQAAGDFSDLSGFETGTRVMSFEKVWAKGWTGKGQVASMADTGLDSGNTNAIHPDFSSRVVSGHAVGLFGKSWADPMGHGTHVAGSIVGNGSASNGFLKGGAPEARFVAQGMWSPMLNNLSVPNKLGDMFAKAYADGARVHSNSWGSPRNFGAYDNFAIQVDEYMFANPEMLVLFAAGNSGVDANKDGRIDSNSMSSPGTAKNALTVGASENNVSTGGIQVPISRLRSGQDQWGAEPIFSSKISDNENGLAMFSSRGPTNDGRIKPDVVAPGTNILSVKSQEATANELWGAYNKDYVWSGGTSMSTPLVAGAATVLRQYLIESRKIMMPSASVLKAVMMNRAIDMFPGQYGQGGVARGQEILKVRPDSDQGYGRVDAERMLALDNTQIIDEKIGLGLNEERTFEVKVNRRAKFTANLVWTDAPGSSAASKALVNDLDLTLTGENVKVASNDRINNHEMIELILEPGVYSLVVRGHNVPQGKAGKQPYALVYGLE
ncbi:MAG: S8 family serine peptidase [Bdellovibrionia bacterium]